MKEKIVREEFTKDDESTVSTLTSTVYPDFSKTIMPLKFEPYCSTTAVDVEDIPGCDCVNGFTAEESN